MDQLRTRKQCGDQAQVDGVVGHLVDNAVGRVVDRGQLVQVSMGQVLRTTRGREIGRKSKGMPP